MCFPLPSFRHGLALMLLVGPADVFADDRRPLHARIDELIESQAQGPFAAIASDAEFLRRVYLDLAGRVPSVRETRDFLNDAAAGKREQLIDELLSGDDYVRRMTQFLHVMLMERLGDHADWQKFLRASVEHNKPWDEIVRAILHPHPDDEATRGAALWYTKRLENYGQNPVDIPGLVRDVGRHFLGIDVQCAQCHDHLFVGEYKQEFYAGLFAFVGHATLRTDLKFPAVGLKPLDKKVEFMSVFEKKPLAVGPKLPGGEEVALPAFAKGEEFLHPPDRTTKFPGEPKFNTLKILAEQLPRQDNRLFTRNMANRLWWLMLGHGLVQPLDLHHADNPPSHPELLDLLAEQFAAHAFDMRWLIREIALSRTYQRSSFAASAGGIEAPPQSYRLALEKPLSAEQMLASLRQVLGREEPLAIATGDKRWSQWQANFEKALANPAREPEVEHNPTVKAALFLMHDATVLEWLQPQGDNLTSRLLRLSGASQVAGALYLAVFARPPSDEEVAVVREYLASREDRRERAVGNLVWSLIASNEFCANH